MKIKKIAIYFLVFSVALALAGFNSYTAAASEYSPAEVAAHSGAGDCWVIVEGKVFDITPVMSWHADVVTCGTDSTAPYLAKHSNLNTIAAYEIGVVAVPQANQAPTLNFIPEIVALEGSLVNIAATASDPDNDNLNFSYASPFNSSGQWQTGQGDAGDYSVKVSVSDGEFSDSQNVVIKILPLVTDNNAPVLSQINDINVNEGDLVKMNANAQDADDDNLTFTYSTPLNGNGEWQTAAGDAGTYPATVSVSDGELSDSVNFNIIVNTVGSLPLYNATELANHSTEADCWVAVFGNIYDLTPIMADYAYFFSCGTDNSDAWLNSMFGSDTTLLDPYIVGTFDESTTDNNGDGTTDGTSTDNSGDSTTSSDDSPVDNNSDDEDEDQDEDEYSDKYGHEEDEDESSSAEAMEDRDEEEEDDDYNHERELKLSERAYERLKKTEERIRELRKQRSERTKRIEYHDEDEHEDD